MTTYRRVVTGVSTLILLVKQLCKLNTKFGAKIHVWAQANLSGANYATVAAFLASLTAVCLILESATDD